jgi:hypothetical protein
MKRTGLSDTSPEAERVLAAAYRAMSPARKWALMSDNFRTARLLHDTGVRLRDPQVSPATLHRSWLAAMLGDGPWLADEGGPSLDQPLETMTVLRNVISTLDRLEIAYALSGSFASSTHGANRQTRNADLSVDPFPGKEAALAGSFGPDDYLSLDAIRHAVRDRSTFNIISTSAGFKVDVFVRKDRPFEQSLMNRRVAVTWPDAPDRPVSVVSAEDIILLKLEWYRLGGEVSERQWTDVIGVLRTQVDRLDGAYLDHWAAALGVADLMEQARRETGP